MIKQASCNQLIQSFVFLDVETTGLHGTRPRITEFSLVALHRDALLEQNGWHMRRIIDKLTLCIYPRNSIPPSVQEVTGLDNDNLQHKTDFNCDLADSIFLFLKRQIPPVCLVAHNGKGLDFGVLKVELGSLGRTLPDEVLCIDSLDYFREKDGMPSMYLWSPAKSDVYTEYVRNCQADLQTTACDTRQETPLKEPKKGLQRYHKNRSLVHGVKRKLFGMENVGQYEAKSSNRTTAFSVKGFVNTCNEKSKKSPGYISNEKIANNILSDLPYLKNPKNSLQRKSSITETPLHQSSDSDSSDDIALDIEEEIKTGSSQGSNVSEEATLEYLMELNEKEVKEPLSPRVLKSQTSTFWELYGGEDQVNDVDMLAIAVSAETGNADQQCTISSIDKKDASETKHNNCSLSGTGTSEQQSTNQNHTSSDSKQRIQMSDFHGLTKHPDLAKFGKPSASYKMRDIHHRLMGDFPSQEHRAEDDCLTLARIFNKVGKDILEWCDANAVSFSEVVPLYKVNRRTPFAEGVFASHLLNP